MPCFNKIGNERKKVNDGITSQKILVDKEHILSTSFVSMYNHISANTETIGTEASIAPTNELCFEISEIITIRAVEIIIFVRKYAIVLSIYLANKNLNMMPCLL